MSASRNPLSLQIFILLLVVFAAVILSLMSVGYNAIRLTDETAIARQERFAARNLAAAIDTMPQQQRSATVWDDAIENVAAGNERWMDDNLGVWMQDYFGHHENFVLDQADAPMFVSVLGDIRSPDTYASRAAFIAPVVAQLRAAMAEASAAQEDPFEALSEIAVVTPVQFGDQVAIVSAVPIIPDTDNIVQRPGTESVHIAVRYVDAQFAQDIGLPIELQGVSFTATAPSQAQAGSPLATSSGDVLAWLVWKPERPGMDLLVKTLPLLLLVGMVGGGILIWCVQRLLRVSNQLHASEAQARLDLAALQQAREAAKVADRAKMNFMSIVSHELRTPLTVILGYARLGKGLRQFPFTQQLDDRLHRQPFNAKLVQTNVDELLQFVTTGMEKIEGSGEHLLFLVNQLLDYAKMEAGRLEVHPERCDVQDVVGPVVEQMKILTDQKGLLLEASITPCHMLADVTRTRQILINLIANATKFTETGKVSVAVRETADQVHIDVKDTGIGIAPDELEKIFEAFHQADLSSSRKAAGTGLGLSVAKELAQLGGGTISARSEVGVGSTFTLSLPKESSSALEKAA